MFAIYREVAPHEYALYANAAYATKEEADEAIKTYPPGRYIVEPVVEPPKTLVDPEAH